MTRDQIVAAIDQITEMLRGPGIPNIERLMSHEDRKALRRQLAEIDSATLNQRL